MASHYRISLVDALDAHERALKFGGREGILNLGLIESATGRPYTGYYRQIHRKAAALVESMIRNHGFVDGNKRTAVILVDTLLTKSRYELMAAEEGEDLQDALEEIVVGVASGVVTFQQLSQWFERRIRLR